MRFLLLTLLLSGSAVAQTAAMYRTVSTDGTVTFSDLPLSDDSEMITVLVRSGATTSNSSQPAAQAAEDQAVVDAAAAEQAAANCAAARDSLQSLAASNRLYRVLPSGERQFLSDEEITVARAEAEGQVAEWCQ